MDHAMTSTEKYNGPLYVLVVERDTREPDADGRPIVCEHYIDGDAASLEKVREFQKKLGGLYGKTRIARLDFIEDWQGD